MQGNAASGFFTSVSKIECISGKHGKEHICLSTAFDTRAQMMLETSYKNMLNCMH